MTRRSGVDIYCRGTSRKRCATLPVRSDCDASRLADCDDDAHGMESVHYDYSNYYDGLSIACPLVVIIEKLIIVSSPVCHSIVIPSVCRDFNFYSKSLIH
jgi:hypothetical protein